MQIKFAFVLNVIVISGKGSPCHIEASFGRRQPIPGGELGSNNRMRKQRLNNVWLEHVSTGSSAMKPLAVITVPFCARETMDVCCVFPALVHLCKALPPARLMDAPFCSTG